MADDTFIREVDEQIRQDRASELWAKYGKYIIALAVLIVLATAALRTWQYFEESKAASFGDKYLDAVALSNDGKHDEAIAALEQIGETGSGQYPALARMRIASEIAARGNKDEAIKEFDAISSDGSFNEIFREVAKLRAGLLAVDVEDYASVEARLSTLAAAGAAFRHSAREALGISALKAGNDQKALEWFNSIEADAAAAPGVRSRASTMLNFLAGKGVKADG